MAKQLLSTLKDLQERVLPGGMTHYDEDGPLDFEGEDVAGMGEAEIQAFDGGVAGNTTVTSLVDGSLTVDADGNLQGPSTKHIESGSVNVNTSISSGADATWDTHGYVTHNVTFSQEFNSTPQVFLASTDERVKLQPKHVATTDFNIYAFNYTSSSFSLGGVDWLAVE